MTIDEAIKHCEEQAEKYDSEAEVYQLLAKNHNSTYEKLTAAAAATNCAERAADHRQLAEWLTELKNYRAAIDNFECRTMSQCLTRDYRDGWNACYDDIIAKLKIKE